MQAALAECHATAPTAADTDWDRIVLLYDGLLQVARSPVVELNRAVAVAMATLEGPAAALAIVDGLTGLDGSYLLPSVRGELLARLGRNAEAAAEFARAAELTDNEREREVLNGQGYSGTRGLDSRHAGPGRHRRRRRGVEHVDGHVVVAVTADVVQAGRRGDDVVGVVTGHRIVGDGGAASARR